MVSRDEERSVARAQGRKGGERRSQALDRAVHHVADDGDHIRIDPVGSVNHSLDEAASEKPAHVHVTKLDDLLSVKACRQSVEHDLDSFDRDLSLRGADRGGGDTA